MPIRQHSFAFTFLPTDTARQRIVSASYAVAGCEDLQKTSGQFSSLRLYGCVPSRHSEFSIQVSGVAETGLALFEEFCDDPLKNGIFRVQSQLTRPGPAIRDFHASLPLTGGAYDRALTIRKAVHEAFRYVPGKTFAHEDGECAFAMGEGVCQDYAHVMLSLLRMENIPSRYVTGMLMGEGASHAWVEALCNGYWYGFDPTNDLLVDDSYIRAACGRDSADCAVIRGTFYGPACQVQQELVRVEQCKE